MIRVLPLLALVTACTGPEKASKVYAYRYTEQTTQDMTEAIVLMPGRTEHWEGQWASRKLKPFDPGYPVHGRSLDDDLDGEPDVLISLAENPDGTYLQYWDQGADGTTDRTHLIDAENRKLEERFVGGYSLLTYDGMGRLSTVETRAGQLIAHDYFSYQFEAPDWIGRTRENGSEGDEVLDEIVLRRELGPSGLWLAEYRRDDGPERLIAERTLDNKDRVLTYTDYFEDVATTVTTTWEGDFRATREAESEGELLWSIRWTQDDDGFPVLEEQDVDGDGIFDESITITYEVDDYGRVILEEHEDDQTGEIVYRQERTDLGLAEQADLDPWMVEPRALADYE